MSKHPEALVLERRPGLAHLPCWLLLWPVSKTTGLMVRGEAALRFDRFEENCFFSFYFSLHSNFFYFFEAKLAK